MPAQWQQSLWHNERKVYKANELTIGTLANWRIANNAYNTGYGIDCLLNFNTPLGLWKVCYQTFEPLSYIDQEFAVSIKQGNKTIVKNVNKNDFDDISFTGEYPIAFINYASKTMLCPYKLMALFSLLLFP